MLASTEVVVRPQKAKPRSAKSRKAKTRQTEKDVERDLDRALDQLLQEQAAADWAKSDGKQETVSRRILFYTLRKGTQNDSRWER